MSKITSAMVALGVVAGLGVTALPLSSYAVDPAAVSEPVTIRATIEEKIAISVADTNGVATDLVDFGTVSPNSSADKIQTITVTVSGNAATYSLGVMDYDQNTSLVQVGDATKSIPAITLAEGESDGSLVKGWGWRLENRHNTTTPGWKPMPAYNAESATNLVEAGTDLTDGSVPTNVQFGINISGVTGLTSGVYEDKIIFTATGTGEAASSPEAPES